MLFDSINRTDLDLRRNLFGTIVLSGGTTLSKGSTLLRVSKIRFWPASQE